MHGRSIKALRRRILLRSVYPDGDIPQPTRQACESRCVPGQYGKMSEDQFWEVAHLYPTVYLKRQRRPRIEEGHPWIFEGEIGRVAGEVAVGDFVRVLNYAGYFIGIGYINPESQITVRLLSHEDEAIDDLFFTRRLQQALQLRQRVVENSNAYRLVHAEADLLPGLIVDIYDRTAVVQILTAGIERHREEILAALQQLLPITGIYERSDVHVRELEGLEQRSGFWGNEFDTMVNVVENGFPMLVDVRGGQKTGYFLDQRENRAALAPFVRGASVLDCFSHTGSFAVHAARYGANQVRVVDISQSAIDLARQNAALNNVSGQMDFVVANAFDFLRNAADQGHSYDVVMLDPPAFTKSRQTVPAARRGYKEINLQGIKLVKPGGYLITSSCSYHISKEEFLQVVNEAAVDAHRTLQLLEYRSQGKDHPTLLAAAETSYLKFCIFRVC